MSEEPPPESNPLVPIASAPTQPSWSADGNSYWNGHQWVPRNAQPTSAGGSPLQVTQVSGSNPFMSGMLGCLGVGAAIVLLIIVGFVFMAVCTAALFTGLHGSPSP